MESFEAMTYLTSPAPLNTMQNPDYINPVPVLDMQEHNPGYDQVFAGYSALSSALFPPTLSHHSPPDQSPALTDHSMLDSGDDMGFSQPLMPLYPIRSFIGNQFEDPFTEMTASLEPLRAEQAQADSSVNNNHKLLDFSLPTYNFTLLNSSLQRSSLSLSAQLHGMFFLAESLWTPSSTPECSVPPPPAELTCYRRNLFQITGSVTLPRTLRYIMTEQGDRIPILAQELTVSATESVEGNPVKIISVPWKTPTANGSGPSEDKTEREPEAIPLDMTAGQDVDSDYATFPIAWKRLQFRVATANNGRRKELQQRFVVRLKVVATLSTGSKIPICEARSGPVIVRGRSPRNFQSRKDLPLSGSAAASRKNTQAGAYPSLKRTSSDTAGSQQAAPARRSKSPQEPVQQQQPPHPFQLQQSPPASHADWTQLQAPNSAALPTPSFTTATIAATIPGYAQSNPEVSRPPQKRRRNSMTDDEPISLSLEDDGCNLAESTSNPSVPSNIASTFPFSAVAATHRRINSDIVSGTRVQKTPMRRRDLVQDNFPDSGTVTLLAQPRQHLIPPLSSPHILNPGDGADLLYEYFPLGLEEWQAPVDAVYRPHVVHHMSMLEDPKAIAARSRSKMYFAGEGS